MSEALKVSVPKSLRGVRVTGLFPHGQEGVLYGEEGGEESQGHKDREEAFQKGYEKATAEWSSRFSEVLGSLDKEASLLNDCRNDFLASLERSVVDLGVAVAEKFLISERERGRYAIEAIVGSVLEKMEDKGGKLTITLNPEDLEDIADKTALIETNAFQSVRLMGDPDVPKAGCRLDTGLGRVAFSLEEQMEEIRRVLMEMEVPENA